MVVGEVDGGWCGMVVGVVDGGWCDGWWLV